VTDEYARPTPKNLRYAVAAAASGPESTTGLILTEVARRLQAEGHRLAGTVQIEADRNPGEACDMVLSVLPDGPRIDITQNLGRDTQSCRLDHQALEEAASLIDGTLNEETQFLIINKFGKRESDGAGFRQTIAHAVELGVPVLLGIGSKIHPALEDYVGEDLIILPEDADAILQWCHTCLGEH
jgi:hypothetical protein